MRNRSISDSVGISKEMKEAKIYVDNETIFNRGWFIGNGFLNYKTGYESNGVKKRIEDSKFLAFVSSVIL